MFAIAAGEVGLQVAGLIAQPGDWRRFLPAYSHLMLAVIVIASSWVGWIVSQSPGGRKDVTQVLELEFVVLLIDVACVICYFVLARQVDFHAENGNVPEYNPSAEPESFWILVIFSLYLVWDFWTKVIINFFGKESAQKRRKLLDKPREELQNWYFLFGVRFFPTLICLSLAYPAWVVCNRHLSAAQVVIADGALLMLVLLFRALKDCTAVFWPPSGNTPEGKKVLRSVCVTIFFLFSFYALLVWARSTPNAWLTSYIGIPESAAIEKAQ